MRYIIYILSIVNCGLSSIGISQVTLNDITKLNQDFAVFTESTWYGDTLFVVGHSGVFSLSWDATIVKYNLEGIYLSHHSLPDSTDNFGFRFWNKGLIVDNGTILHTAAKALAVDNEYEGLILKTDLHGNFLDSSSFKNFYYPNQNIVSFPDFKKLPSGYIVAEMSWKGDQDAQSCLLRLDTSFNKVWRYCYGNESKEIPNQVFALSNGHFVVQSNSTDLDITEIYQGSGNAFHRGYIFEVDEDGNLEWEWRSADLTEATSAGYLENDSTLIVASGMGIEKCTTPGNPNSSCQFLWTGGIYKFNLKTREKIWETRVSGGPSTLMFDNSHLDIIPSIEKDGYIISGAGYDLIPDCRTDTVDKCWANPGVIAKISNDGDSLWLRKYFGVIDIYESNRLVDAEITPDSGYSFVGEAFNPWPGETQGQHGWLLMTDKYGCLVPGCQLISSTEESHEKNVLLQSPMKIYPNPGKDFINVLITTKLPRSSTLHLLNSTGQELDRWHDFEEGGTYTIPVQHLVPGAYFMIMRDGTSIIGSQQVMVN